MWQLFREWFSRGHRNAHTKHTNVDDILGSLKPDPKLKGSLHAVFFYLDRSVELRIDPDDKEVEECLIKAREMLTSLKEINDKALLIASNELLATYNDNWRFLSQRRDDGSYDEVENPALTPEEFQNAIRLTVVSVVGSMVEFFYADSDLFAGHSIIVHSFDGLGFTDASAEIFG